MTRAQQGHHTRHAAASLLLTCLSRGIALALGWWVLVEGRTEYLGYGLVAVPVALAVSLWLSPSRHPRGAYGSRARGIVVLVAWVCVRAVAGGIDVARRSLTRPVDIAPSSTEVDIHLPDTGARALAFGLFSLMPGTIAEDIGDDRVLIHALSSEFDVAANWAELEGKVAAAAGLRLL